MPSDSQNAPGLDRRDFLRLMAAAGAALALPGCAPAKAPGKRGLNIVFILTDDLGWADVSCNGRREWTTPNIDHLAASGLRFTQAYAAGPVCSPTRASILTGQYPARLHLTDWIPGKTFPHVKLKAPVFQADLPSKTPTFAQALQAHGYATAVIGKWHVSNPATRSLPEAARHFGFADAIMVEEGPPVTGPDSRFTDDLKADHALRWLDEHRAGPFCLLFTANAVHAPIVASSDRLKKYLDAGLSEPMAAYAGMVEGLDQNVGRLLDKLDELKLADSTLVVFFSDNGGKLPFTSNTPLRGGKGELYEGGIRVPLIVRYPGVTKAGSTCEAPVISTDFFQTLLTAAHAPSPARLPEDGGNLAGLCAGGTEAPHEAIFWHYPHYNYLGASVPASAIRQGDWKLIDFLEDGHAELYNLKDDPSETRNLADREAARTAELRRKLTAWRRSVDAQMPAPNPAFDPVLLQKRMDRKKHAAAGTGADL